MNTWNLLKKELNYYGINLTDDRKCEIYTAEGRLRRQGILKTIRQIKKSIKNNKKLLVDICEEVINLLQIEEINKEVIIDEKLKKVFIFSLKDLAKFLLCFEELDNSTLKESIESSLNKDIKNFSKEQISQLPDYKISLDWIYRLISRLNYILRLLSFASMGEERSRDFLVKEAKGISGPWANLDLPILERVFPYEDSRMREITKGKEKQRRYRKGFENYNGDGRVSEGHYWREIRNEPFSWYDKQFESPYPSRSVLSR